ncbi:MAG: 30S ribosomal protein S15 [Candidatus Moraniibacteriota bacterium]
MALSKQQKQKVTKNYKNHEKDSGSAEYQIALFTEKIKKLTSHLKINPKDKHSRKGLLGMVQQRKKLLQYLKKRDEKKYKKIIKDLSIKG